LGWLSWECFDFTVMRDSNAALFLMTVIFLQFPCSSRFMDWKRG
jgi:hypothetical protein